MANETNAPAPKAKGYVLAQGTAVELRGLDGIKITNDTLKQPGMIALIQARCPEAFGTLIVAA
jgi:hypothetical protein